MLNSGTHDQSFVDDSGSHGTRPQAALCVHDEGHLLFSNVPEEVPGFVIVVWGQPVPKNFPKFFPKCFPKFFPKFFQQVNLTFDAHAHAQVAVQQQEIDTGALDKQDNDDDDLSLAAEEHRRNALGFPTSFLHQVPAVARCSGTRAQKRRSWGQGSTWQLSASERRGSEAVPDLPPRP